MATALGCDGLTSGDSDPVAIEFVSPPSTIAVGETIVVRARALNRNGDSIPGAPVFLFSQNPDTLEVDSARSAIVGRLAGVGRLVAIVGDLPTSPLPITVTGP